MSISIIFFCRFLDEICIGLRKKEASGIDHALSTAPATSMPAPDAPMMWEAHAFTLAAGKDLGIPIPEVPAGAKVRRSILIFTQYLYFRLIVSYLFVDAGSYFGVGLMG